MAPKTRQQYLDEAGHAREVAHDATSSQIRETLLKIAETYERLAEDADRARDRYPKG
jgi:hypothetical protein